MDISPGADLLFAHLEPSLFDCLSDDIGMGNVSTTYASSSAANVSQQTSDLDPESGSGFVFVPRTASDDPVIPTPTVARRPKWKKTVQEPPPPERAVVTAKLAEQSHWWQDAEFNVGDEAYDVCDAQVDAEKLPAAIPDSEKSSLRFLPTRNFLDDLLDACGQGKLLQKGMVCNKFTLLKACLHNKPLKEKESKLRRAMSAYEYSVHGKIASDVPVIHPQTPAVTRPVQIDKEKMDQLAASLDDEILKTPSYSCKPVRRRARKVAPADVVTSGPLDTTKYTTEGAETEQNRLTDEESSDEDSSDDEGELVNDGAVAVFNLALKLSLEWRGETAALESVEEAALAYSEEQPLAEMDLSSSAEPFVENPQIDSAIEEIDVIQTEEELPLRVEQPTTSAWSVSPEIFARVSRLARNSGCTSEHRAEDFGTPERLAEEFGCGRTVARAVSKRSESEARIIASATTEKWQDRSSESVENSHFPFLPDPEAVFRKGKGTKSSKKRTREDVSASPQKTPKRQNAIIPNSRFAYRRGPEVERQSSESTERRHQTSRTRARITPRSDKSDRGHSTAKKVVVYAEPREFLDTETDSEPEEEKSREDSVLIVDGSATDFASSTNTSASETRPARLNNDNATSICSSPEIPLHQPVLVPVKKLAERLVIRSKNARFSSKR